MSNPCIASREPGTILCSDDWLVHMLTDWSLLLLLLLCYCNSSSCCGNLTSNMIRFDCTMFDSDRSQHESNHMLSRGAPSAVLSMVHSMLVFACQSVGCKPWHEHACIQHSMGHQSLSIMPQGVHNGCSCLWHQVPCPVLPHLAVKLLCTLIYLLYLLQQLPVLCLKCTIIFARFKVFLHRNVHAHASSQEVSGQVVQGSSTNSILMLHQCVRVNKIAGRSQSMPCSC